jgi:hypothetical protein
VERIILNQRERERGMKRKSEKNKLVWEQITAKQQQNKKRKKFATLNSF